ncbi:maleylpyruvate isomerase family mycothiol-dependent enzyme [Catenulispora subtropica]|uniref:Mycothiol-dependent maleylpyruvate isomerase metal-binding domain-containing protein n=1 Tax=Catenulispora subtropica TaxID=450798 RepID=A0ABP5DPK5_9ACTN
MSSAGRHYRVIRTELTDLAATLSEEQAGTAVPALPGWSVHDTYAHLAGVCADILAGTVGDPHDTAWTAGHVAAREQMPLAEICEQWSADAPRVEELLDTPEMRRGVFSVFDVFHHAHDIRGALGRVEARDTPQAAFVAGLMTKFKGIEWGRAGHPPIQLATGSGSWRFGAEGDEVVASLETSDFELARIVVGRRSRAQMLAAGWKGDPEGIVDFLPVFGPPVTDLTE